MPANVKFKWATGPKRAKAKQIPDDVWEAYESQIREMHTSMTHEELASEMKRIHGFEATPRQWIARLDRWGLKKYKIKDAALEGMAEGSREDLNLENSPIAIAESSKRGRNATNIDDRNTEDTGNSPSGRPSAKKLKKDDDQALLHEPQVSTLAENGDLMVDSDNEEFRHEGGSATSILTATASPGDTIVDSSADVPHEWQGDVLSEAIMQSILIQSNFVDQSSVQDINIDLCLSIALSIEISHQPHQGHELSFETENHLKVIADYLFAMERFAEATNIYSIISESERSHRSYSTFFYSPTLMSAARAARSEEDCRSMQRTLTAIVDQEHREFWWRQDQSLAHILLANLSSRLEPNPETWFRNSSALSLMSRLESETEAVSDASSYLLVYVYYKWLRCSPSLALNLDRHEIPSAQAKSSVSFEDFEQFFSTRCANVRAQTERIVQDIAKSVQWCLEASTRFQSAFQIDENAYDGLVAFANLWRMWHGGYSQPPRSSWSTTMDRSAGISLAEHLNVCAKVIRLLATAPHEFYCGNYAITLYLQTLYEGIETHRQPAPNLETIHPVSERVPVAGPTDSPKKSPLANPVGSQMGGPKLLNLVPTIAPSLESANSSFGRFRDDAAAMALRQLKGSPKADTALSTPRMSDSPFGSITSMNFLSRLFAKSLSVNSSSPPQEFGSRKFSPQHTETRVNDAA